MSLENDRTKCETGNLSAISFKFVFALACERIFIKRTALKVKVLKDRKIPETTGKYRKILENTGKYRKIHFL